MPGQEAVVALAGVAGGWLGRRVWRRGDRTAGSADSASYGRISAAGTAPGGRPGTGQVQAELVHVSWHDDGAGWVPATDLVTWPEARRRAGWHRPGVLADPHVLRGLRWWASGSAGDRLAVEVLAEVYAGRFVSEDWPWVRRCQRAGWYWLDPENLRDGCAGLWREERAVLGVVSGVLGGPVDPMACLAMVRPWLVAQIERVVSAASTAQMPGLDADAGARSVDRLARMIRSLMPVEPEGSADGAQQDQLPLEWPSSQVGCMRSSRAGWDRVA